MAIAALVEDGTRTLAVLGDSTAAGIGDPIGSGRFRGFGPLLALALGEPDRVRLVNTGRSGARVACVRRDQVPVAVAARPQLAVLLVGLNDTLRADFDPGVLHDDLSAVVAALAAGGATVVCVRFHHHGRVFPLPRPVARALDDRIDELNRVIDLVVREQAVHCLDLDALPACYRPSTWSIDRLHPSARGHRELAQGFADLLRAAGHPVSRDCLDDGDDPVPTRAEEVHWLVSQGVPWLCRRSRDFLPLLVTVALRRVGLAGPTRAAGGPCRR
jgi:lysophospholipase L1-like esterase